MNDYTLIFPNDANAWQAYHDIRRVVLFEARGQFGVYNPNLADDRLPNHHAKLLLLGNDPVGVVRIDIDGETAILRRVAIRGDVQRRGHGRALIGLAEKFAQAHGCTQLASHVALDAEGFYQKCGFMVVEREPESVLMSKAVATKERRP